MATSMVSLTKNTWKEVSTVSVIIQIPEQNSAYAVEASTLPTNLDIRKKIQPGQTYTFQKNDGNLYMICPDADIQVSVEPIV